MVRISANYVDTFFHIYYSHEHIELLAAKGEVLFFRQRDGPYMPCLKLLHKCRLACKLCIHAHMMIGKSCIAKARGSHYHKTCRTIRDQDQNEIKQSRGCLGLNKAIKERFK